MNNLTFETTSSVLDAVLLEVRIAPSQARLGGCLKTRDKLRFDTEEECGAPMQLWTSFQKVVLQIEALMIGRES